MIAAVMSLQQILWDIWAAKLSYKMWQVRGISSKESGVNLFLLQNLNLNLGCVYVHVTF